MSAHTFVQSQRYMPWGELALVTLFATCSFPFTWLLTETVPIAVLCSLAFGTVTNYIRLSRLRRLRDAAGAGDETNWTVQLNGIAVGKVANGAISRMTLDAFSDHSLYFRQTANFLLVNVRFALCVVLMVPVLAFWALVSVALSVPEEIVKLAASVQDIAAPATQHDLRTLLVLTTFFSIFFVFWIWSICGLYFGYVNHFSRRIANTIRGRLNLAADGYLEWTKDAPIAGATVVATQTAEDLMQIDQQVVRTVAANLPNSALDQPKGEAGADAARDADPQRQQ